MTDPVYGNVHIDLRSTSRDHHTDVSSHPCRKKRFLVFLCVLLLVIAITTRVLYVQVSIKFATLQVQFENATSAIKALASELEGPRKCAANLDYFNGSLYYFSSDEKNWADSRDACVAMGGHLVVIDSEAEMTFLIHKGENHWIGLNQRQPNGSWYWVDNKPLTTRKFWGRGQPDNAGHGEDCVQINLRKLNDANCYRLFKRICEL